jgi:heme/copper-type cytochrome/quinol oxidase subunit 2
MMVMAIASGSAWTGAAIMMAFTLGTSPLFFALGLSAAKLMSRKSFRYIAASVVIFLGILSVNTGQALRGSSHTVQNYLKVLNANVSVPTSGLVADVNAEGKQEVSIKVANNGYSSSVQTLKVGVPVKLTLNTQATQGCSRAFTIPTMNISKLLPESGETTIEFTPTKTGRLAYTCSMGMYTGAFTVIN